VIRGIAYEILDKVSIAEPELNTLEDIKTHINTIEGTMNDLRSVNFKGFINEAKINSYPVIKEFLPYVMTVSGKSIEGINPKEVKEIYK
jgi:hypothetical protein